MKKILVFSILFFIIPLFVYADTPADFPDYEKIANITHQGTCDNGETKTTTYQDTKYFLEIAVVKNGTSFYTLSKDPYDPYHYFVKESGLFTPVTPDSIKPYELDKKGFEEKLKTLSPNYFNEVSRSGKSDCTFKKIK